MVVLAGPVQAGTVSGLVRDRTNGVAVQGATVTVQPVGTSTVAGTATTDAAGRYAVTVEALGKFTLVVAREGFAELKVEAVIELAEADAVRRVDVSLTREGLFKDQGRTAPGAMSWTTGAGKSYLIPALEIPTFLFLLNRYDRYAYSNMMEDGKKVYASSFSSMWQHAVHGPWIVDRDGFAMNERIAGP